MPSLRPQLAMELWVLRPYAKQFVMLPAIGLALGFLQDTVVPVMVVMAVLTASYGFSITENAHLETLFATLPTSRRHVVTARYLVIAGILVVAGLAGFGFDAAIAAIRQQPWSPLTSGAMLAATLAVAGTVLAIQLPFYFALGYTRAKIVTWAVVAAVGALIVLLTLTTVSGSSVGWEPGAVPVGLLAGGPLSCLAVLTASAAVSVRIYARKDL